MCSKVSSLEVQLTLRRNTRPVLVGERHAGHGGLVGRCTLDRRTLPLGHHSNLGSGGRLGNRNQCFLDGEDLDGRSHRYNARSDDPTFLRSIEQDKTVERCQYNNPTT